MATATQQQNGQRTKTLQEMNRDELLATVIESTKQQVEFVPYLEQEPIKLSPSIVAKFVANKTRSGKLPDERDIINFMALCKALRLNPFVRDAFLVGYDSNEGPKFSLITAYQALLKRAEGHEQYDGMKGGIIVRDSDGNVHRRDGAMRLPGDTLHGAWATVWRKDRKQTTEIELELGARLTERPSPIWKSDPCGMIVKCAKSAALREAFPSTLGGMYTEEELDLMQHTNREEAGGSKKRAATLKERLSEPVVPHAEEIRDESHDEPAEETYPDAPSVDEYSQEESEVEA